MIKEKHWSAVVTYREGKVRIISVRSSRKTEVELMKSKDFDKKFDENKTDIIDDLDLFTLKRPNQQQKRVNVDFPVWVIDSLDKEAGRVGITPIHNKALVG